MEAIFFALVSYFCWGTGDIFATIASRKSDVFTATFWSSVISLVFFAIVSIFFLDTFQIVTWKMFLLSIVIGVVFLFGFLSFTKALIVGNAALVGTIVGSYGVVTVLLSIVFFQEKLTREQLLAILVIFSGIILSTLHYKDLVQRKIQVSKGILYAIVTMVLFGVWGAFIKIPIQQIGWFWPNFIMFLVFPVGIFLIASLRRVKLNNPVRQGVLYPLAAGAILARVGELSYNLAISKGVIAVVAPIASSFPTLFVILAFLVFKDKITKQQLLGVIVTLIGIVLLSFYST